MLLRVQLFLHRNDRFRGALTWVVPVHFLVTKSRIELSRIDGGIGDDAAAARRQNESFGGCDHLAAYSPALETWLYRDQSQRGGFIIQKIDPQRAQQFAVLPETHEMIGRRSIVGMMTIIPASAAPFEEDRIAQIMHGCGFDLISRRS
jgi:hypothetical protein